MSAECRGTDARAVLFGGARRRPSLVVGGEIIFDSEISPGGAVSATTVRAALKELSGTEVVPLRFTGGGSGGSVAEALQIYLVLRECGRPLVAHVEHAASMGTIIAMAASEVLIVAGGVFMIHMPAFVHSYERNTAAYLRALAAALDDDAELMIDIYHRRTQLPREELAAMMTAETFLTAEDAVRHRFADRVIPRPADDACPQLRCPLRGAAPGQNGGSP